MTHEEWRSIRMLTAGVLLVVLSGFVPQPLELIYVIAGFIAVVRA